MQLLPNVKQLFVDTGGLPLAGGKIYFYVAGTTTPQATYTDASGGTPNANPLILDANGQGEVWIDPTLSYKVTLKDSAGVLQWSRDNVKWTPNLSVGTAALVDASVTTAKINDAAVTSAKINALAVTTAKIADSAVTTAKINDAAVTSAKTVGYSLMPVGAVIDWPFPIANIPTNYELADGGSLLIANYPELAAISLDASTGLYCHGSVDVTHFNKPDRRGKFVRGIDNGSGNDPDVAGRTAAATNGNTGDNVGSIQASQIASHTHVLALRDASANGASPQGTNGITNAGAGVTAGAGGNETRPLNASTNYIVKVR